MSAFTHHRRFHRSRHWHYFNQSEKSPGSLAELLWRRVGSESYTWHGEHGVKYMHTIGLQIAGLYCQPFFSQFSKAKTSKGHFQSQIDHSTQGKPLKKASRRPREQNASLCSGRVHTQDCVWSAAWRLRPHKEFPAVFGTLFGYLFPGGLVRKVRRCGEVPQRRAQVTSRIAALADNMAAS